MKVIRSIRPALRARPLAGLISVLILLVAPPARSARVSFPVTEVRVISDGSGASRILIRPADLSELRGQMVARAFLEFPLEGRVLPLDFSVRAHALLRSWDGRSVSWDSPWEEPGGDFDEGRVGRIREEDGSRTSSLRVNVSPLVRAMARGEIRENGFLLTVAPSSGDGFDAADLRALGSLANGTLEVRLRTAGTPGLRSGRGHFSRTEAVLDGRAETRPPPAAPVEGDPDDSPRN